ncbi:MAG: glycoside hydrolase family 99-like domain-containing protein [Victivallaceae bacterium]|nr:glycoside hydrolase family 99-like domain-containing protein [Victivallaceae bacterium]
MFQSYDIAAYIWPAFTGDEPRTRIFWPDGMGEWQTVKNAVPKFPGHQWPRQPRWGYVNEADPCVMEMEINAAADHGVNVFIYDWYWYDRRPFLENCLNDGYLKASNHHRVKFYLMWANHDVGNGWDIRNSHLRNNMIWSGMVDFKEFQVIARRVITNYFRQESYYCIDGKPVFMIYDLQNLINGLGGIEATRCALDWFRKEVESSGFPGVHLQAVSYGDKNLNLSGVDGGKKVKMRDLVTQFSIDSITNYQFAQFVDVNREYPQVVDDVREEWNRIDREYEITYFPHVSIGWDNNPRFKNLQSNILKNGTPEAFQRALEFAKEFIDAHPQQPPLLTINSWNEWTEASYLQPDDLHGYGYLEAVKSVFSARSDA